MVKERKRGENSKAVIRGLLQGILIMFGIYVLTSMLLALLVIKGKANQSNLAPLLYVTCVVSAYCAGKWMRRSSMQKIKAYALLPAVLFSAGYVLFVSAICMQGIQPEEAGLFMLCALAGGGLAAGTGKKTKKGRRLRK